MLEGGRLRHSLSTEGTGRYRRQRKAFVDVEWKMVGGTVERPCLTLALG